MASPKFNSNVPKEGTTFVFGSWDYTANGSGGFDSHLTNPSEKKTLATAHGNSLDEFFDQLNEIELPVHIKPDHNSTSIRCLSPSPKRTWTYHSVTESGDPPLHGRPLIPTSTRIRLSNPLNMDSSRSHVRE